MSKTKCFFKFLNDEDRLKLKQSRCLFTISVGQQTHEGDFFRATIDLLNESFSSCVMLVDDTLQRYTMAIRERMPPDYFYDIAMKEGDRWLERNERYFARLDNLEKIIRWNTWLNHCEFGQQKNKIRSLICQDHEYASAFESSVSEYVDKCINRTQGNNMDIMRMKKLSFDFILEECTALCLWTELACHYEAYPGLHNQAICETKARFIHNAQPSSLKTITLGFRQANQLTPQKFVFCDQVMGQQLCNIMR